MDVVTVSVPLLSIAPPEVPVVAGEELPLNVDPETDRMPWLKIAPPPCTPLLARPLASVSALIVRLPAEATSKIRNAAVPAALDLLIVSLLPTILTLPVMTGRPVPPSVVLFAAVSVYVQPVGSVMVAPPVVVLAVLMAATRPGTVQVMAADAAWAAVIDPRTGAATATVPIRRRSQDLMEPPPQSASRRGMPKAAADPVTCDGRGNGQPLSGQGRTIPDVRLPKAIYCSVATAESPSGGSGLRFLGSSWLLSVVEDQPGSGWPELSRRSTASSPGRPASEPPA